MLVLHALQPRSLLGSLQEGLGLFGEREEPLRVSATDRVGVARGGEALAGELPDRLQHPVALVREAKEALLDERLQRVEIGCCDLLRRVERAATREDRERSEETLLLLRQEVVAPRDGRPERLLSGVGVSAASQQVESLGETLDDLTRGEGLRAGGGELNREWEVVEARAELRDLVRGFEPRSLAEERDGLGGGERRD